MTFGAINIDREHPNIFGITNTRKGVCQTTCKSRIGDGIKRISRVFHKLFTDLHDINIVMGYRCATESIVM